MQKAIFKSSVAIQLIVHFSIWLSFFYLPLILMPTPPDLSYSSFNILNHLIFVLICVSLFYTNYFIYIPKLLLRKRIIQYIIFVVLSIIAVLILLLIFPIESHKYDIIQLKSPFSNPEPNLGHGHNPFPRTFPNRFPFINPVTVVPFVIWILSTGIKMTSEWYKSEKQKANIEKEKINTELEFLNSQVNPHFIFNALNNICSLARKKSDETEMAIITLSNLLRYNIYDSKKDKVYLYKEIQYLNNYIGIQKLRLHENIKINFIVNGNIDFMIEPLILITFVENAFKHGINTLDKGEIYISIFATSDSLQFIVKNSLLDKKQQIDKQQGIGLNNVIRRLNLLYPGKHKLSCTQTEQEYIVELIITLDD